MLADLSPAGRQRILVHAIGGLLRAAPQRDPMLVVLDDLHWADPASLAVIEELLDILPGLRVVLLATYRSNWSHGWEGRSAYEQLNLRALRPEDARLMAQELAAGREVSSELTERVLERSAGNPLFLQELLHGERGGGDGQPHGCRRRSTRCCWRGWMRLPPETRRTLQLASVVGMEFPESIVADLSELDAAETEAALRDLQRAELVAAGRTEHTLVFRHPLIHEVAYGSLLLSTRRALHGRIGRWLEEHGGEERVAELARHYRDSDDQDEGAPIPAASPASGPRSLNANREAYGWFTDAAAAFADDPLHRAEMIEAAAQQRYLIGEIPAATELQEEAIAVFESVGAERQALNARRWLVPIPLAAGRQGGVGAPDRARHHRSRAPRTQPGAGDGVQLPLPEPHARARLRRRRVLGAQGDRGCRGDRCHGRPRPRLQQPRVGAPLAGRAGGRRLPASQPGPGDREPPAR